MDIDDFKGKINALRKSKEFITNSFFSLPELLTMLGEGKANYYEHESLICFIVNDVDVFRIYYYAASTEHLSKIQNAIFKTEIPIVLDVISRANDEKTANVINALTEQGFDHCDIFIRMKARKLLPNGQDQGRIIIRPAVSDETIPVLDMIKTEFDATFAHFPTLTEIEHAIYNQRIIVASVDGKIAGMSFFDDTVPSLITLRYFIVSEAFRRTGIGKCLFSHETKNREGTPQYQLWLSEQNEKAKHLYKKMGFDVDGTRDIILAYERAIK